MTTLSDLRRAAEAMPHEYLVNRCPALKGRECDCARKDLLDVLDAAEQHLREMVLEFLDDVLFKTNVEYDFQSVNFAHGHLTAFLNDEQMALEQFFFTGLLPMKISPTGRKIEPLSEVIICDSMSGGANYKNNMPKELSLIRHLADGTEYRMRYTQDEGGDAK